MNIWCFIVLSLVITSSSSFYQKTGEDDEEVLIVDTDIGGGGCNDVDDVGAICVALELERLGGGDCAEFATTCVYGRDFCVDTLLQQR